MAIYTDESEITDYLITSVKKNDFTNFINTYLLRGDSWFIDRCELLGVAEDDIVTYAEGQKYGVIQLLRVFVYIEALKDLYSINLITDDDYFKKLEEYRTEFEKLDNALTYEMVIGDLPVVNPIKRTGRRITLQTDLYNTTSNENRFC